MSSDFGPLRMRRCITKLCILLAALDDRLATCVPRAGLMFMQPAQATWMIFRVAHAIIGDEEIVCSEETQAGHVALIIGKCAQSAADAR